MAVNAFAQVPPPHNVLFYNNGQIYLDSTVVVQIYGNTISTGPTSLIRNEGEIYVHFDSIFLPAKRGFTIDNQTSISGNGYYEIEPDWTNNTPYFNAQASRVHLMSDIHQKITGSEPTSFYQLVLSGKGIVGNDRIKRMTVNSYVFDSLSLTNRELATDSFTMHIYNTESTAISYSTVANDRGFVSSVKGDTREGSLLRRTNSSDPLKPYVYPVGSSLNPPPGKQYIYRPVDLVPKDALSNQYTVRFAHESPDLEGYDQFSLGDSICSVNPLFYHVVNHPSGFQSARVRIYYDPLQDGIYDYMAKWGNGQWNLQNNSTYVPSGNLFSVYIIDEAIFSRDSLPFILADRIPGKPEIIGDNDVCSGQLAMLRAMGNTKFYEWEVPAEFKLLSGASDDTVIMQVYNTSAYVHLTATSATGRCVEAADSFLLVVNPGPDANFSADIYKTFTNQEIRFKDSTLGAPIEWFWNFGDGNTASSPIVKHQFKDVGDYLVEMYVKDENGCIDSTFRYISIIEGITVPNVFTPNGDGTNDVFYIPNSGVKEYHLQIFNRWGNIMFETTATEIAWDGHNNAGDQAMEGTYYYILEAKSDAKDYVLKGYLTLFR
jgi:gliding motility-associated-like protein